MWAGSEQECDLSTTNRTCTYVGGKQKNTFKLLIDIHLFDDTLEKNLTYRVCLLCNFTDIFCLERN